MLGNQWTYGFVRLTYKFGRKRKDLRCTGAAKCRVRLVVLCEGQLCSPRGEERKGDIQLPKHHLVEEAGLE